MIRVTIMMKDNRALYIKCESYDFINEFLFCKNVSEVDTVLSNKNEVNHKMQYVVNSYYKIDELEEFHIELLDSRNK